MKIYKLEERLEFSQGIVAGTCVESIRAMIPGCVRVTKTHLEADKSGIDYVAHLRGGGQILIDHKAREGGCREYWKGGMPELALEIWSVKRTLFNPKGVAGWTLDESKQTEYTFHTFDPDDSRVCYLIPFQLLRMAFIAHYREWYDTYKHATQSSGGWESECVFVPAHVVQLAVTEAGVWVPSA